MNNELVKIATAGGFRMGFGGPKTSIASRGMAEKIEAEQLRAEVGQTDQKRKDRPGRTNAGSCEEGRKQTNLRLGKKGN